MNPMRSRGQRDGYLGGDGYRHLWLERWGGRDCRMERSLDQNGQFII